MASDSASAHLTAQLRPSVWRQLRRLVKISGRWSCLLWASAVAGLALSAIGVASADLLARLTNSMLARNIVAFTGLVVPAIMLRSGEALLSALTQYSNGRFGEEVTERIRRSVSTRLSRATAAASAKEHSGQTLSRLTNDLGATQNLLQSSLPTLFTGSAQAAFAIAYMLWKHWLLALVAVLGAPIVFLIVGRLNGPVMALSRKAQEILAKANETVTESLSGAEIVRSFGLQDRMYTAFNRHAEAWLGTMKRYSHLTSFAAAVGFGAAFTPFILVFGIGGFMVIEGQIEIGMLLAFMELLNYVSFPMQESPRLLTQIASDAASAERVLDLLDTPVEREDGRDFAPRPSIPIVEFRAVTFTYPGTTKPVLTRVSFSAPMGAVIAVAGASGSGKSTLFRLLLGDYEPDAGEILVFGHRLSEWSLASLRKHFSSVNQETYLFPISVAENLRLGRLDLEDEQLWTAARIARADDFIRGLPGGYDTAVGELGNRVSGGERQRLSLARALLHPGEILLLDEATSALDYHSERQVIEGIRDTWRDVTTLVIAHRLSSVEHADRVLVLDGGMLVESGTHGELLAKKGRYYDLYRSQDERGERS